MARQPSSKAPSDQLDEMIVYYLDNVTSQDGNNGAIEIEAKFGTIKEYGRKITRNNFDNVAKQLVSQGFFASSDEHLLRIETEYQNQWSNIRTKITGLRDISTYCRNEQIDEIALFEQKFNGQIPPQHRNADFNDFNFRVSMNIEKYLEPGRGITKSMEDNWQDMKKRFRLMNRTTFEHKDYPFKVDLSIVKSSTERRGALTFNDSGVANARENYEIEIEFDNDRISDKLKVDGVDAMKEGITKELKKVIKIVLSGLQSTNYPVSISEQDNVKMEYHEVLFPGRNTDNPQFIGPSSYTLQIDNIVEEDAVSDVPNIRDDYTVTDKADGVRKLLFITKNGRIYMIDMNMNVQFTGATTDNKFGGTLIDGEHIQYNKKGEYSNLYAAFDIYYMNGKDCRSNPFYKMKSGAKPDANAKPGAVPGAKPGAVPDPDADVEPEDNANVKYRYNILVSAVKSFGASSVVPNKPCPLRIDSKVFIAGSKEKIFEACKEVLTKVASKDYIYETDGLIFTPCRLGVGADKPGEKMGAPSKKAWRHSFKWKPPEFNTIDFLVKLERKSDGEEIVGNMFKVGQNVTQHDQLTQYKKAVLHVGFDTKKDGFPNAFQDVMDGVVPEQEQSSNQGKRGRGQDYVAKQFYPTNPYDHDAALCNLMLTMGANGKKVLKTEEGEVIEDQMVVEFSYDGTKEIGWRWTPLRVRYDKTADTGGARYGNNYNVANNNWHSIFNPVTEAMISTGKEIGSPAARDEDVYYNRESGKKSQTIGLRDYHNWLKNMLITKTANPGNSLIDLAVGKGGDLNKWSAAKLGFVFGIDYSKDNIVNRLDGACARYLGALKRKQKVPKALFAHGDSSKNMRNLDGVIGVEDKKIVTSIFASETNDDANGLAVRDAYGIGSDGFDVCSIQFAIHYMFESPTTLHNFLRNVSETTKVGGYFIGTSYDGDEIFKMLKGKKEGESESISGIEKGDTIWKVTKRYSSDMWEADSTSVGYAIDVYQETINKVFTEYLVNYGYLNRLMEDYGFVPDENKLMGKTKFIDFYGEYLKNKTRKHSKMNNSEEKVSFLNRLFIFKKVRSVNAEQIANNMIMGITTDDDVEAAETQEPESVPESAKSMTRKNRIPDMVTKTTRKKS